MDKIRAAVVGVGYLGRFHAQKYAQLAGCDLVAVVDGREEVRNAVAAEVRSRPVADYRELLGKVDAVSVVTPTPAHFEIAEAFLAAGAHVLVEKPITETPEQARRLIGLAAQRRRHPAGGSPRSDSMLRSSPRNLISARRGSWSASGWRLTRSAAPT